MKLKLLALLGGIVSIPSVWGNNTPRPAPELTIKLPGGATQQLSQYKGKVVALEFLLTTCGHCQRTSKALAKMQQEYGSRGFQVIGVAINPMAHMAVPDFVKQFQINFPVGYDVPDTANSFLQHPIMIRMLMPQVVFIDRTGVIRGQFGGENVFFQNEEKNMRTQIEELLNDKAASKKPASPTAGSKKKQGAR